MPFTGVVLGLGGLLPFLATSIGLWWQDDERFLQVGLLYGAVILSFLGGIQWGHALGAKAGEGGAGRLVWSVIPSLVAWTAVLAPPIAGPWVLGAGVFAAWLYEQRAVLRASLPEWYRALRHLLTFVVIGCMVSNGSWVALRW
jgi:hypothetical protein